VVAVTTRLWLVRHGATDWSEAGRFNGRTDVSLNELGRRQSERLRERLRATEFDGIWRSDLVRATETARLAGAGTAFPDRRLREIDFGALEGLTWAQCPGHVQEALVAFDGFEAPGGESVRNLTDRVLDFVDGLSDGSHLVFTHGGVIRALLRGSGCDVKPAPGELLRVDGETSSGFRVDEVQRGANRPRPFG
jgi:2,3-bisphosphoglycerate-dependent phosphoglycerate mutase